MKKWLILLLVLFISTFYGQRPRFKAAAFYSTKGEMDHINFARDALYLVRPDGYVAFATAGADRVALQRFLDEWASRPFESLSPRG